MRDNSGVIAYIGETDNLARRSKEQIRSRKLAIGDHGYTPECMRSPIAAPLPRYGDYRSRNPSLSTSPS